MIIQRSGDDAYEEGNTDRVLNQLSGIITEFLRACEILPRTAPDGASECPFSERLWERAFHWRNELQTEIGRAGSHRDDAERGIQSTQELIRRGSNQWIHLFGTPPEALAYHQRTLAKIRAKLGEAEKALATGDARIAERRAS